ncbi:uncharacterized protein LOC115877041 [Sitophilus oryzae]|uniref:Uncharacterized protein LOC115877041 n=1 Tax=Sitophilus oryzae TaxID=7048 RepID=A0A6J2XDV5_SITOR|nr:uncharacterized protein LOC115877041 [Sitophilus oryzae]
MPRNYKRKAGARKYADYTEETLLECLNEIKHGRISHRAAEEKYKIPRRTILNKLKCRHSKKPGHQPIFTADEEREFVQCIISLGDYGFPVNMQELRNIIKNYLARCGREVKVFKENTPGTDWLKGFLVRNPELSQRFAENVKRMRAAVDEPMIRSFFENLSDELRDVPPTNIWNFDETNLSDDPGKKKVIVKKGSKYPELIRNASKTSISVMFSGNAAGELLPPYIVYRANKMWTTWTENGPKGCRYNSSSSGWFDASIFSDWLECQMIPRLKKLEGKKVVLCDNLSSHITVHALKLCRQNQITLICLPPNSTHLTQPLDVAFFRPLKIAWRRVLSEWKDTDEGIRNTNIQKQNFPPLLSKMMEIIGPNVEENLKAGFRKCGIVPLKVEEVLSRIPRSSCNPDDIQGAFLQKIQSQRIELTKAVKSRRKKLNIPPGRSVCLENLQSDEDMSNSEVIADNETLEEEPTTSSGIKRNETIFDENSSDDIDFDELVKEQEKEKAFVDYIEGKSANDNTLQFKNTVREIGSFVVFSYEGLLYPGKILRFNEDEVVISSMEKSLKMWKWPSKPDEIPYSWDDVLGSINPPKQVSKRGIFAVPELTDFLD